MINFTHPKVESSGEKETISYEEAAKIEEMA